MFRKTKATSYSHMGKIDPKDKYIHKNKHDHIQTYNVCNSGTTLWNLREEGKEKGMTEHQQYWKTYRL
jgi:DNA transposition AAA+ family ATPase